VVRAFSLPSESLSYFIGFALLHSDEVAIVSPWLSNVELRLPVNDRFDVRSVSLLQAVDTLEDTTVHLIVRAGESHNDYVRDRLPAGQRLHEVDDLHAKAVVTDTVVYLGSANITRGGLSVNRELCELLENEHGSVAGYLDHTLDLTVTLGS
jgi:phosphatidylserine/phosphatidylglycerophosphate/cardiolipin synthase-like enzyme